MNSWPHDIMLKTAIDDSGIDKLRSNDKFRDLFQNISATFHQHIIDFESRILNCDLYVDSVCDVFPIRQLVEAIESTDWDHPGDVMFFHRPSGQPHFTVSVLASGDSAGEVILVPLSH